jgi:hypothetical protein
LAVLESMTASRLDEPDDDCGEDAELMRSFRDIADALQRGDVDGLAAALSRADDPAPSRRGALDGRKKVVSGADSSFAVRPLTGPQQTKRWRFWNIFRFRTRNDSAGHAAPR